MQLLFTKKYHKIVELLTLSEAKEKAGERFQSNKYNLLKYNVNILNDASIVV